MRLIHLFAIVAGVLLGAAGNQIALGAVVTVSINNDGSFTEHAVTADPGDAFRVDVNVHTGVELFDLYDMKLLASADDVFAVTSGPVPPGDLDPVSAPFSWMLPFPVVWGPGEWTVADFEILVNPDAVPDVYTLDVIDGKYTVCRICPAYGFAGPGPEFTVTVVPEPTGMLLLTTGMVALLKCRVSCRNRRRRHVLRAL